MQQIGRYQVLEELARGGMGVVYKGYDTKKRFEVAIKVLLAGRNATEQARERFHREARALGKLRHPHIVAVDEVGDHEGNPYLVMELLQGESLQARLDRDGPLPVAEALTIARKVAEALHCAHEQGILHRDVKPENVVIDERGEPLLADFGLTRDLDPETSLATISIKGRCMGTPGYWPPEQAHGELEKLGPHSDVYALGGTLVALLTGLPPHGEPTSMIEAVVHTTLPVEKPSARRPELGEALDAVCLRALAVAPGERYASAEAFAADLDAVAKGSTPTAARRRPAAPQAAQPRRSQLPVAIGIGVLGVVATAGILAYRFPERSPTPVRRVDSSPTAAVAPPAPAATRATPTPADSRVAPGPAAPPLAEPSPSPSPSASPLPSPSADDEALARAALQRGMRKSDPSKAIEDFTEAIRLDPDMAWPHYNRGLARGNLGDLQGAIEDFTEAIRLDPDEARAHYNRGIARARLGDHQGQIDDCTKAIRLDPTFAPAYHSRGLARGGLGDHQGALEDFTAAIRLDPGNAGVYHARGVARGKLGDHQGALEEFTAAIRLDPGNVGFYYERGVARGEALGDLQGQIEDCTEAIRLRPDYGIAFAGRGFARGRLGDHTGAVEDLERALDLDPNADWASQARGWLGEARRKLGEQRRGGEAGDE